ncbi:Zinc finger C-x8-C-x5-C-x3-H type family protein, putative isoform 1 [Theobroma cacao]|uniref:Zinc finger C-x8-C-x5-C-x3-H type family protein, putative isoform 1 n=1 Tax=Theobroma cacao TaxID=3641 RepID=A0A061GS52_THECC|nr:Zinc finger C-x8-C-x5-C-x3-H type family protein, putative isoform 1 [Theobroma cacao]EOY32213.1 Zinc finger C-x8-C-x5-C-x3-H type family protein, putative isoform 1 [Theobroma cacao]
MHYKKEPCRNFQRGSCQYGERCKFLHVIQQQPKSNAFGFGTQASSHQQQKPNPFGFGVQNNVQSKGANDFGNKQNQFKNTWTRSSASSAPSLRQPDNQPQATNHQCTDPELCKRTIIEDFEHERPLWKLTCYSHWKNSPCDIVGDVSFEELRATAYDDAKHGLSLQSIVERERNLLNSKLVEFENLLRNPYTGPVGSTLAQQIPFPTATATAFSPQNTGRSQNGFPPSVSSFSQLGASLNSGSAVRPSIQSNNAFGQPISFSSSAQASSVFATNNIPLANAFSFGNQQPNQSVAAAFTTSMSSFSNSSVTSTALNQFSAPVVSTQNLSLSSVQPPALFNVSNLISKADGQSATDIQLGSNLQRKIVSGDSSVWLKEKWIPGEIPEEAPPDAYV